MFEKGGGGREEIRTTLLPSLLQKNETIYGGTHLGRKLRLKLGVMIYLNNINFVPGTMLACALCIANPQACPNPEWYTNLCLHLHVSFLRLYNFSRCTSYQHFVFISFYYCISFQYRLRELTCMYVLRNTCYRSTSGY